MRALVQVHWEPGRRWVDRVRLCTVEQRGQFGPIVELGASQAAEIADTEQVFARFVGGNRLGPRVRSYILDDGGATIELVENKIGRTMLDVPEF